MSNKFLVALGVCGLLLAGSTANAAIIVTDTAWYNGNTYYLLADDGSNPNTTWTGSESYAQTVLGADLVTINDAAENSWLLNQWGASKTLWLGLRREPLGNPLNTIAAFAWDSGEAITYTNWEGGEPNNNTVAGIENYVHMYAGSGKWNDISDDSFWQKPHYGVAEKTVPEPSTMALIGMALFSLYCLGLMRRRAET